MITSEEGPFSIFERIRVLSGVKYDQHSQPFGTNNLSRGLLCSWCVSVWLGLAVTVLLIVNNGASLWFMALNVGLATSTGAILLDTFVQYVDQ